VRAGEEYALAFAANVSGPMHLTRLLLPSLRQTQGQIVFINSTQGLAASPGVGMFAATQHALRAMADSLRDEVNGDGVRVLTVYPGRTATPRQARIFEFEGRPYAPERLLQPEDIATMIIASLKLPTTAEVTNLTIRPMLKS
jgi:NADP-dependent 3-hydroxy acid dehydrogenase YdfG